MSKNTYLCPKCRNVDNGDSLWEEVEVMGWRGLDDHLKYDGTHGIDGTSKDDWSNAFPTGHIGCSCGWEGTKRQLVVLGIDGQPLTNALPGQISIEEAIEEIENAKASTKAA